MKAIVMSDSHKNFNSILRIMDQETERDLLIHAGDVQQDVEDILSVWPEIPIEYVLGNNDYGVFGVPYQRLFSFGGKKIFLTHGHMYHVKSSLIRLIRHAQKLGADICVFGHTHLPYLQEVQGMWVLNPGSTRNSYAVIEVQEDGAIRIELKDN